MELFAALENDIDPPSLRWGLSFARGYLELGMVSAAERELARMSVRERCHADVIETRIRVLLAARRFQGAAWLARSATRVFPGIPAFYVLAAQAYEALNQPDQAKAIWISAPTLFHMSGVFHYNLARFEAQLGNQTSAREHITLAIELDPAMAARAHSDPRLSKLLPGGG